MHACSHHAFSNQHVAYKQGILAPFVQTGQHIMRMIVAFLVILFVWIDSVTNGERSVCTCRQSLTALSRGRGQPASRRQAGNLAGSPAFVSTTPTVPSGPLRVLPHRRVLR